MRTQCNPVWTRRLGKSFTLEYPCIMLNVMVAEHNTNDQYATLVRLISSRPGGLVCCFRRTGVGG